MQYVIAIGANTMDVIDSLGKATVVVSTRILLHELFESVLVELLVLHVKVLVLLHVGLVLEGELASRAITVKMCRLLSAEWTIMRGAIFAASKPEEAFALNGVVFAVIIEVHLDV